MTDQDLLGRFVVNGDGSAFQELVTRHAPRVRRVCRRLLGDEHSVDDACQATFLTLLRKAGTIREPERLAGWLSGVADRTAMRVRRGDLRRWRHERSVAERSPASEVVESRDSDPDGLLREELDRLPESYREAIELCYFSGLGHEEAATRLGWPLGTLKARLVRGRRRLRERLDRRGLTVGAILAGCLWPWRRIAAMTARSTPKVYPKSRPRLAWLWIALGLAAASAIAGRVVADQWQVSWDWADSVADLTTWSGSNCVQRSCH